MRIGRGGCVVYMYIYNNRPHHFFRYPRGGGSLKWSVLMIDNTRSPPGVLMARPCTLDIIAHCPLHCVCPSLVELWNSPNIVRHYDQQTPRNAPFWVTKYLFCCVHYFAISLTLGSELVMMILALLGPAFAPLRSSAYFFV